MPAEGGIRPRASDEQDSGDVRTGEIGHLLRSGLQGQASLGSHGDRREQRGVGKRSDRLRLTVVGGVTALLGAELNRMASIGTDPFAGMAHLHPGQLAGVASLEE